MISFKSLRQALLMGVATFGSAAVIGSAVQPAYAQEVTRTYNIGAQDLNSALREFAMQTGRDVLYPPEIVAGKRSPGVQGQLTERQALEALLAGTGLRFEQTASNGYAVQDPNSPTRLGDAGGAAPSEDDQRGYSEILVIGQRPTLNADVRRSEDDIQPYVVIDREEIARSGAANVFEYLNRSLPQESSFEDGTLNTVASRGALTFRGFDPDEVLVLVDGRRIASLSVGGEITQPDIRSIPASAVERIEILTATAAAIYGGGATGAVVNIVLRRDYRGLDLAYTREQRWDGDAGSNRFELTGGANFNDGRTTVMLAAARTERDAFTIGKAGLWERYWEHLFATNPATPSNPFLTPVGTTTNIVSLSGAPLTLIPALGGGALGSNMTFVPVGYAGPASDSGAGLIANAGQLNLSSPDTAQLFGGDRAQLEPSTTTTSIDLTLRHRFSPSLEGFLEAFASENVTDFVTNPGTVAFLLFAGDPGNPFNEHIVVRVPTYGADVNGRAENSTARLVAGLTFELPFEWRGLADYSWERSSIESDGGPSSISPQANLDITSGALNVFRDLSADGPVFASYLTDPAVAEPADATSQTLAFRFSGPLPLSLPGGQVRATTLVEHRSDELDEARFGSFVYFARSQSSSAVYAEILAPVISEHNNLPLAELLEVQLSLRGDWYDVNASNSSSPFAPASPEYFTLEFQAASPTVGLRYMPTQDVLFRASYAEGFQPPSMADIAPLGSFLSDGAFFGITDPLRGNEAIGVHEVQFGGNPGINPERSETLTAGIVLTPRFLDGLRFSIDWIRTDKVDAISSEFFVSSQETLDRILETTPERIIRDTDPSTFGAFGVGPIIGIDSRVGNIAETLVESIDYNLDQVWQTPWGELALSARASELLTREVQLAPTAVPFEVAGQLSPRFSGNATLALTNDAWTGAWTVRYQDSYDIPDFFALDQGGTQVDSQTYHDIFVRYVFPTSEGLLEGARIEAGINNIFDELPPIDASRALSGGASALARATGTRFYVTLRREF